MLRSPDPTVLAWLDRQPQTSVWTTSITVFEIRYGLLVMAAGKRRTALLQDWELLLDNLDHRVAVFDAQAAHKASELMARRRMTGRTVELRDTMIAAIALAHHATVATRNTVHFEDDGITLVNPWNS